MTTQYRQTHYKARRTEERHRTFLN